MGWFLERSSEALDIWCVKCPVANCSCLDWAWGWDACKMTGNVWGLDNYQGGLWGRGNYAFRRLRWFYNSRDLAYTTGRTLQRGNKKMSVLRRQNGVRTTHYTLGSKLLTHVKDG